MITDRATTAEKAKAWEMLMSSTGPGASALQDAWEWLELTVKAREMKGTQRGQSEAMKRFLAEKFASHANGSVESYYYERMRRYAPEKVDVTDHE